MDIINRKIQESVNAEKRAAWEAGFYAGQNYGRDLERHNPQWDMDGPPGKPENPYRTDAT